MRFLILFFLFLFSTTAYPFEFATGHYTGNGTGDTKICFGTGGSCTGGTVIDNTADYSTSTTFTPDVVIDRCNKAATTTHMSFRTKDMAANTQFYLTTTSSDTQEIKAFGAGYFTVGTSVYTNESAVVCHYIALANDAHNDLATFAVAYCASGCDVTLSPAIDPEIIIGRNSGTQTGVMWVKGKGGDYVTDLTSGTAGNITGCITTDNADGFHLGSNAKCNANTKTFYGFALKSGAPGVASGYYTGQGIGTDNYQITSLSFNPRAMFIHTNNQTQASAYRFGGLTGDLSWTGGSAAAADFIQQFLSNGFEVGTNAAVDYSNTYQYSWAAIGVPVYTRRRADFIQ